MNVLLSISPEYAEAIFSGQKKYEFRRTIFKNKEVATIYLYANSSVKRIVGCFDVGKIYEEAPSKIWKCFNEHAGISREAFFQYFEGCKRGYAIEIVNARVSNPHTNPYKLLEGFTPPQSFCYLSEEQVRILEPKIKAKSKDKKEVKKAA